MQEPENVPAAVACLNEMVTDALKHVPHCLTYLGRVRDWHIFRFCAIPQVSCCPPFSTLGLLVVINSWALTARIITTGCQSRADHDIES